jgi:arsenate reductase
MAEGFLRDMAGDRFDGASAGYQPAKEVCVEAIEAMREVGIDISGHRPKVTDQFLGQRVNYVITLCDRRKERNCPIFPGVVWRHTWPFDDPQGSPIAAGENSGHEKDTRRNTAARHRVCQ